MHFMNNVRFSSLWKYTHYKGDNFTFIFQIFNSNFNVLTNQRFITYSIKIIRQVSLSMIKLNHFTLTEIC